MKSNESSRYSFRSSTLHNTNLTSEFNLLFNSRALLIASSENNLNEELSKLPLTFTTKDKMTCSSENAKRIISTLKKQNPTSDTTDGIKIKYDEKNWVMIRPSGTEPIVRIYAEAKSQQKLDDLIAENIKKIKSILSE